jgi:predicted patatin/cPLA2 family phospholipase
VLIEIQQLGEKYIILKSRKTNDENRETLLEEIENFLKKSGKIGSKFSDILKSYNSITSAYNNLPKQVLWYKNSLPLALKVKTKEDYLQASEIDKPEALNKKK